ncbi:bZIP transcription factor 60-like [Gossypium australe]|uniref:BZIP transcription factor 60-like n=1 Tax=Gossypium australe TaxID=47621 RepID=A0A5B6VCM5_9ROSI|nr:bZIP transcription factor 60-like [Gossypium australe]
MISRNTGQGNREFKTRGVFVDRGDQKVLMEDDNFDHRVETQPVPNDDFMADLLVDLPPCSGGDVVGVNGGDLHK